MQQKKSTKLNYPLWMMITVVVFMMSFLIYQGLFIWYYSTISILGVVFLLIGIYFTVRLFNVWCKYKLLENDKYIYHVKRKKVILAKVTCGKMCCILIFAMACIEGMKILQGSQSWYYCMILLLAFANCTYITLFQSKQHAHMYFYKKGIFNLARFIKWEDIERYEYRTFTSAKGERYDSLTIKLNKMKFMDSGFEIQVFEKDKEKINQMMTKRHIPLRDLSKYV